jgi:tetratricopeptide (TPR) repeat protein
MINLLFSLLAGVVTYFAFHVWLPSWWQALAPALIAFPALYFYLSRRSWKQLENIVRHAYKTLEPMAQRVDIAQNKERRNAMIDESIKLLQNGYKLCRWQFLVRSQIDAHIGVMLYREKQDMNAAQPYLEKSFKRNWLAQAMLAVIYMKKHRSDKMEETFEMAVRLNKKEDLLWNLYAYCLCKIKQQNKALEVLGRACKILPNNKPLIDNLVALQNNKKMRMKDYNEQWYQFHIEKPPVQRTQTPRFSRR